MSDNIPLSINKHKNLIFMLIFLNMLRENNVFGIFEFRYLRARRNVFFTLFIDFFDL